VEHLTINSSAEVGVGLRAQHFKDVKNLSIEDTSPVAWFEVTTENILCSKGRGRKVVEDLRQNFPISLHGVSLSIATVENLNYDYLEKLKRLIHEVDPFMVSDHLCWTGTSKNNLHNLLPFPYTFENLEYLANKVSEVQDFLGREIALENLSAYLHFNENEIDESEFLKLLAKKSGCKILLDVNNIYVNSKNQNFNPKAYVDNIPKEAIAEIHLAGFTDMGDYLFDTHSCPVHSDVWQLYKYTLEQKGKIKTLIEWDEDIPKFFDLVEEASKAYSIMEKL